MSDAVQNKISWLPSWVIERLHEWHLRGKTGVVELNFSDGGIRSIAKKEIETPRRDVSCLKS